MSSFDINNAALADSASFTKSIFNNYYPGGQSPVKNTSASTSAPVLGRTLSTRTISSMINGDVFSRNPVYATKALRNSVSSSLNAFITGGATSAAMGTAEGGQAVVTIANPESQGDKNDTITLSNGEAYARIMANSISGKNLGSSFVDSAISNIEEIENNSKANKDADSGIVGPPSSEMQSAGRRDVALIEQLSEEEKGWFNERLTLLKTKYSSLIGDKSAISGFTFDIPNQWADGPVDIYNGEDTYFPNAIVSNDERALPDQLIKKGPTAAYIAPALIEFLLLMHEKNFYISGDFDAGRNPQGYYDKAVEQGRNATYLSDHTFGRAIDIKKIGRTNKEIIDLWSSPPKETYDSAVRLLLEALADIPQYLLPDLIVVSGDLKSDYGITAGNEPTTASIKINKPYLEYVNFSADYGHRNHIHLSFSGMRAGKYVGPGGQMVIADTVNSNAPANSPEGIYIPGLGSFPVGSGSSGQVSSNLTRNYYNDWGATVTTKEIFDMLRTTGLSDELAAIYIAIIGRESGGNPTACNPNALTGDFMSLGIFQINMGVGGYLKNNSGTIKTGKGDGAAHGTKTYELTDPNGKEQIQGWRIAVKNWKKVFPNDSEPTIDNFNKTISEKYESLLSIKSREIYQKEVGNLSEKEKQNVYNNVVIIMRELVDHRYWIPINQAWAVYTMLTGNVPQFGAPKLGSSTTDGYYFRPYGDYKGRSEPGWLRGIKFSNAADVYVTSGKSVETLKKWLRDVYKNDPDSYHEHAYSRNYIDRWLNGEYFSG